LFISYVLRYVTVCPIRGATDIAIRKGTVSLCITLPLYCSGVREVKRYVSPVEYRLCRGSVLPV